jgi:hypothetical protein
VNITAIPSVSKMMGVTRVLRGQCVTNVLGDNQLQKDKEKLLIKKYILRAIAILQMNIKDRITFSLEGTE